MHIYLFLLSVVYVLSDYSIAHKLIITLAGWFY